MWDNDLVEAVFVETDDFMEALSDYLPDSAYQELQSYLMATPEIGKVIRGCGGLRKLRWRDPRRRKGKRGGLRVIYLHLPEIARFLMLDIYDKDEAEDLSPEERRLLADMAETYRREETQRFRRS